MSNKKMLGDIMKQAQALQERMAKLQEEAAKKTVEASSGGGMVTVKVSGRQQVLSVAIDPEIIKSGDVEMLQDLIMAAVNEGLRKSQELMAEEMKGMTGGLNIPGLF
ncbi:MAG: YbaB/EbfC family nucleoid-associated protein [Candidatus Manganitrophus sp. SA1]|uniref:Nucleoid-associated protein MNODULE_04185 n=1 Tax=Candidatus Manganitrophus noduliformans TaxID=2606439 RepID=A0A7X6IA18_9BACT|nr:YbaB/EbfC family nucleoid-associated protein [Candidatus Manganitrophus noduliformans]MCG3111707.1 YbaB/EbfC family nucleoid-associated protein [Candidatus Manganitrophus morganii]MCG3117045.1 YbaB/EbfC family nucleoid-associated protein [Candidatus Manganitrophus morganii]NKE69940.1 YbaB/EbfC family nucleoid-associated protein [Candidatus Manganitrophus noduliformans]